MSFYNMLFGSNPAADLMMAMLNLSRDQVGRFRDCYPNDDGTVIIVYTRNGGGNRDEYQGILNDLSKHPNWIRDYDDDYDCTYASIEFSVPDEFKEAVKQIADQTNTTPPAEKFKKLIDDLQSGAQNANTARAMDIVKRILGTIEAGESGSVTTPDGSVTVTNVPPKEPNA